MLLRPFPNILLVIGVGKHDEKKKKTLIIVSIITLIVIVLAFFVVPKTVLKYKSDDGTVIILITQSREFKPVPLRNQDYTLIVKKKDGIFSKTLLKEDFSFYADCSSIASCFVNIDWYDNSVTITIDSEEMNKKELVVSW